jgi:citrate lyase beta subunit
MLPNPDGKPRRSPMFVPMNSVRHIGSISKNDGRGAGEDCLLLELEDSVPPSEKDEARENLLQALDTADFGDREVIVRINALETEAGKADLKAIGSHPRVDAILLPKVESAEQVELLHQGAPDKPLWLFVETPKGVMNINSILEHAEENNVQGLIFGNNDYSAAIGVETDNPMRYPREVLLTAGRAHGLTVLDGPHTRLPDRGAKGDAGLTESAQLAKDLGFDGKCVIHPLQVPVVNKAFTPTDAEVGKAEKIVTAAADHPEGSSFRVEGIGFIEPLHVKQAYGLKRMMEAISSREQSSQVPRL